MDAQKSRINSFEQRNLLLEKKQHELKVQLLEAKKMLAQQTSNAGSTNTHSNGKDVKVDFNFRELWKVFRLEVHFFRMS